MGDGVTGKGGRVFFIVIYFGPLPSWMPLYLKSCELNPNWHWLLFTDQFVHQALPVNVTVNHMTIKGYEELASRKLNRLVKLHFAYTVCDHRMAFGKIFEDFLVSAEFWGHTDIDIFYGNLNKFVTSKILDKCDIFSMGSRSTGHFQIYRNSDQVNGLYLGYKDQHQVFNSYYHYGRDEAELDDILRKASLRWIRLANVEDEMRKVEVCYGANILMWGEPHGSRFRGDEVYFWENGSTFQTSDGMTKEFPYLHLLGIKLNPNWRNRNWVDDEIGNLPDKFYVTLSGIKTEIEFAEYVPLTRQSIARLRFVSRIKQMAKDMIKGIPGFSQFRKLLKV